MDGEQLFALVDNQQSVYIGPVHAGSNDDVLFPLCLCRVDAGSVVLEEQMPKLCQAIDFVCNKHVSCNNKSVNNRVYRSSVRVPFAALCESHLRLLDAHFCCPSCGVFCIEGAVYECKTSFSVHYFHRKCLSALNTCPHCDGKEFAIVNLRSDLGAVYDSMSYGDLMPLVVGASMCQQALDTTSFSQETDSPDNIVFKIPCSRKQISPCGLPPGPLRTELEIVLLELQKEKTKQLRPSVNGLFNAARSGELSKLINLLLDCSPNVQLDSLEAPLHLTAAAGHFLCTYVLLQAGAYPNVKNGKAETPLHLAISANCIREADLLIRLGADPACQDKGGMTPLHIAARMGYINAVQLLASALCSSGRFASLDLQDAGSWTPLMYAAEHGHSDVVEFLLSHSARPDFQDKEFNVALHWAAISGNVETVIVLLKANSRSLFAENFHGDTPLHIAARNGFSDIVSHLLLAGADPLLKNKAGDTPLDITTSDDARLQLIVKQELLMSKNSSYPEVYERVIMSDLAKGRENFKIPVVNGVDSEKAPTDFRYLTQSAFSRGIEVDGSLEETKDGVLVPEFNPKQPPVLFECNSTCNCSMACRNRVVQKGCQVRIEVFKTAIKGWGVRALEALPRGKFIIEYVGEVLSEDLLQKRSDEYLFDLDSSSFSPETSIEYSIDAKKFGNVSRFFNHSCEPNVMPIKVFIDHWDLRFPRIAFFTIRPIKKLEELCFDYGPKFWAVKSAEFLCNCNTSSCKYNTKEKIAAFIQLEASKVKPNYLE